MLGRAILRGTTETKRQRLRDRWDEINARLAQLTAAGAGESEDARDLLGELDEIEYEIGLDYITKGEQSGR